MSIEIRLKGDMLVVVEGELEPSTDVDEGHSPTEECATDAPRIVFPRPFGWGSGQERKDAPDSG